MLKQFRTHDGQVITGEPLQRALNHVANWYIENAYTVRTEDAYASHVSEERKELNLANQLALAERIRAGNESGFWLWQRLNTFLTGECVAMLPK